MPGGTRATRLHLLLPAGYMLGIFVLSSIPDTGANQTLADRALLWMSPSFQNLLHIPLFGGLAASWYWALLEWMARFRYRIATALAATLVYSVFDEVHQLSVPGRFGSWTDIALNATGAVLVVLLITLMRRRARTRAPVRHPRASGASSSSRKRGSSFEGPAGFPRSRE